METPISTMHADRMNGNGTHPDALLVDEVGVMLIAGLRAREREIQRDIARAYRVIERTLGLAEGALGTTHNLFPGDPPVVVRVRSDDAPVPRETSD